MFNKKIKLWKLSSKMQNYVVRNHKLSPMTRLEFQFLKRLYWYMTKQYSSTTKEFKEEIYKDYINIVNLTYKFNRIDQNPLMQETIIMQLRILLNNEISGPRSFIMLNFEGHVQKMKKTIDLFEIWFMNPDYHGYASENEFWEAMDFLRKQFNQDDIDIYKVIGKWPKKFRSRRIHAKNSR
jgi:hypothetical protein